MSERPFEFVITQSTCTKYWQNTIESKNWNQKMKTRKPQISKMVFFVGINKVP